jgi:hypothetical protein
LRTFAKTFPNKKSSLIAFIPDEEKEYTLLIPYNILMSHINDSDDDTYGETDPKIFNSIDFVLRKGIGKETGFNIKGNKDYLGLPIDVTDSLDPYNKHLKHVLVALKVSLKRAIRVISFSGKTGEPIWLHNSLLSRVYDTKTKVGDETKIHPQKEAFERYMEWLEKNTPCQKRKEGWFARHFPLWGKKATVTAQYAV